MEAIAENQWHEQLWKEMRLRQSRTKAWSLSEQRIYINFLRENSKIMRTPQLRKKHRVFRMLSKQLKTRTPIQVKAHHQKYQERYKINSEIIEAIEKLINKTISAAGEPPLAPTEKIEHVSSQYKTFSDEHSAIKQSLVKLQASDQITQKQEEQQGLQIDWQQVMAYNYSQQ